MQDMGFVRISLRRFHTENHLSLSILEQRIKGEKYSVKLMKDLACTASLLA
jgi:hypothetical protein